MEQRLENLELKGITGTYVGGVDIHRIIVDLSHLFVRPPRHVMTNSDVQRIINSDEVQRQLKRKG